MTKNTGLEIFEWVQEGYKPLVFSSGWQVAILNWEPGANVDAVFRLERHLLTNEIFFLSQGSAALVIVDSEGLRVVDAVPGRIYNVIKATWHTVIGTWDSSWLIVENKDTHLGDTEYRPLDEDEMKEYYEKLPEWAV